MKLFKLVSYILIINLSLLFFSCGDDTSLKVPQVQKDTNSDLTSSGVKIKLASSSYYDGYIKDLFTNYPLKRQDSEVFYFNFTPETVSYADSYSVSNSSLLLCKNQQTFSNSYAKEQQINFLRDLREALSTYNLDTKVLIVGNKPSSDYKYSTIYVGKSYYDLGCGMEQGVKGVAVADLGNVLQNDSAFMFTASGGSLSSYVPVALDLIFTMLGVSRSNTTVYKPIDISSTLGQNNITSMARILWETESKSFDISIFQDELHGILLDGIDTPDSFESIMAAYTTAISSNSSSPAVKNLASLLSTLLNGESLSGLLNNIKNKNQTSLPDFAEYLELTEVDSVAKLVYVYTNQMEFIKNSSFDAATEQALEAMLLIGFSQKYKSFFID